MLLFGSYHLLGSSFADSLSETLTGDAVPGCQQPVVDRLSRHTVPVLLSHSNFFSSKAHAPFDSLTTLLLCLSCRTIYHSQEQFCSLNDSVTRTPPQTGVSTDTRVKPTREHQQGMKSYVQNDIRKDCEYTCVEPVPVGSSSISLDFATNRPGLCFLVSRIRSSRMSSLARA